LALAATSKTTSRRVHSVVPVIGRDIMLSNASALSSSPSTRIHTPAQPVMESDFVQADMRTRWPR
jgi:hypothetical protein